MPECHAIVDKNVVQAICGLDESARLTLWNELKLRYRIVLPWILIEEVWMNYVNPGPDDKVERLRVVQNMINLLANTPELWLEDEVELAFQELVIRKRALDAFPAVSKDTFEFMCGLSGDTPGLKQWAEQRRVQGKALQNHIRELQNSGIPPGKFNEVKTGADILRRCVFVEFRRVFGDPTRAFECLRNVFGERFISKRQNYSKRVDRAFRRYTPKTYQRFPLTTRILWALMFYDYAPLFHIHTPSVNRPILKRRNQGRNYADSRYIANALMFDRLITRDKGMADAMSCFIEAGVWSGKVIYLPHQKKIEEQIPMLLN